MARTVTRNMKRRVGPGGLLGWDGRNAARSVDQEFVAGMGEEDDEIVVTSPLRSMGSPLRIGIGAV